MKAASVLASMGLVAALAASCDAGDAADRTPPGTTRVVVDTDMGTDDVMALLFLLERDDVSVEAVTVAGDGLTHCAAGVRNARALLALAGSPEVPVACGREKPLAGQNAFPDEWRTYSDDLSAIPDLPTPAGEPYEGSAVDLLLESLDGGIVLLTLGPMTNVAGALRADPDLAGRVDRVVSMAGAIDARGNAPNGVAEFNVWIDALAAKEVAEAMPVELVPLDASNSVPATPIFVEALGRHLERPSARAIHALLEQNGQIAAGTYYFWDPLAAVLVVDPAIASWTEDRLLITASLDAGAGWISRWDHGIRTRFATRADGVRFERAFLASVTGTRVRGLRPRPDVDVTFDGEGCGVEGRPLHAGRIVVRFANDSDDSASVVLLMFPGTTYGEVVRFLGPPGSTVSRRPDGIRQVALLSAEPGVQTLGRAEVPAGDAGVFCGVDAGAGTARIWPGEALRIEA
jgi:pyrimidine-specific ribonucleoside hydrolase